MVRIEHACLDGSAFPVEFASLDDTALTWRLDREHAPTAMRPLAEAVRRVGRAAAARAQAEGASRPAAIQRPLPRANGYEYTPGVTLTADERSHYAAELDRVSASHGGSLGLWEQHCLPRIEAACSSVRSASPDTRFAALAEQREYVWGLTSLAGVVARRDLQAVTGWCATAFGDRAELTAFELAQGSDNETMTAGRALAALSRMAPDESETTARRLAFEATYGGRSLSWPIDQPTLAERPATLDAQLRLLRRAPNDDDAGWRDRARRRRDDLAATVADGLDDTDRVAFEQHLDRLRSFVPIRGARAHWQLVASGAMRTVVRRRGQHLRDRGLLDDVDDIFFLTPEEYDEPTGDLRSVVRTRRTDHEHWSSITPPPTIGATAAPPEHATAGTVRGAPGAAGVAQGIARVILDLADLDRFAPGDILVTTMTSPPWTPIFGLAAAVVTDAGDAMSHVAIAAREYGIPCVVGTDVATIRVPDGATITVDGDAGLVRIEP